MSFATLLSIQIHLSISAMNVTMEVLKDDVSSVAIQELRMPITVVNASSWGKIERDALKLSIWVPRKQISFMNGRSTGLKSDRTHCVVESVAILAGKSTGTFTSELRKSQQ